jgi:hypothetical protein
MVSPTLGFEVTEYAPLKPTFAPTALKIKLASLFSPLSKNPLQISALCRFQSHTEKLVHRQVITLPQSFPLEL